MKKILSCLLLGCACALSAEEPTAISSNEEIQFVFEKDYLHADDTLDMFYLYASKALQNNNSSLTPTELVKEFKNLAEMPEFQEKYLSIYRSHFNSEEIKKISELLENEVFMAYRERLGKADLECHMETMKRIREIIERHPSSEPSKLLKERNIPKLTKENKDQYFNSSKPLVIDVYTDWCGPCKYLAPILEELNREYDHVYQFVKLNAEDELEFADEIFKIEAFPTVIFIKDGQEVGRVIGFMNKDKLLSKIQKYCD